MLSHLNFSHLHASLRENAIDINESDFTSRSVEKNLKLLDNVILFF